MACSRVSKHVRPRLKSNTRKKEEALNTEENKKRERGKNKNKDQLVKVEVMLQVNAKSNGKDSGGAKRK